MQGDSDTVARGARVVRLDRAFRWPGGRHLAVVLNLAYEGWSDGKAPGIGPMGNPLPAGTFDSNALSWGSYGATRGIERLLRVLDRAKCRASVMVSGVFGERTPDMVPLCRPDMSSSRIPMRRMSSRRSSHPRRCAPISSAQRLRSKALPGSARVAGSARAVRLHRKARVCCWRPTTHGKATCSIVSANI